MKRDKDRALAKAEYELAKAEAVAAGRDPTTDPLVTTARKAYEALLPTAAAPPAKRLKGPTEGMPSFVRAQLLREVEVHQLEQKLSLAGVSASDPQRVWALATKLSEGQEEAAVVRACYEPMAVAIERAFAGDPSATPPVPPTQDVLHAGSRGTGKSVLGTIIVLRAALAGKLVVYRHKGKRMLVVTEKLEQAAAIKLHALLKEEGYAPLPAEAGVYELKDSDDNTVFDYMSSFKETLVVHDVGEDLNHYVDTAGANKRLVISSPDSRKLKYLRQEVNTRRFFMLLLELDELAFARTACFPNIPEAAMRQRYEEMSGVVRGVLRVEPGEAERVQAAQVNNTSIQFLENVFRAGTLFEQLPSQRDQNGDADKGTDLIFKVVPTADWRSYTIDFVSERVGLALAHRFAQDNSDRVVAFAEAVSSNPALAAWRGHFLVARAHKLLRDGIPQAKELPPSES